MDSVSVAPLGVGDSRGPCPPAPTSWEVSSPQVLTLMKLFAAGDTTISTAARFPSPIKLGDASSGTHGMLAMAQECFAAVAAKDSGHFHLALT